MSALRTSATRRQSAIALLALVALLGALAPVGMHAAGVVAAVAWGAAGVVLVDRASRRADVPGLGPAGAVTLARAVLIGGVLALLVSEATAPTTVARPVIVGLAAPALLLDGVDGAVARRTRTATAFGARLDMELDAATLLVLSLAVAGLLGPWVLLIGTMRYLWVAAARLLPWLDGELPVRRSAKVVAGLQGAVLVIALADVLPRTVATGLVAVALGALVCSFAVSTHDRWLAAAAHPVTVRPAARALLTLVAATLVLAALIVPHEVVRLVPAAFLRVPVEAVVGAVLVAVLAERAGRILATVLGALLGVLALGALSDVGFDATLARPFDPVLDGPVLASGVEFLTSTLGTAVGTALAVLVTVVAVLAVIATALAARRLARPARRHRTATLQVAGVAAVVWLVALVTGTAVAGGSPVAAADAVGGVRDRSLAVLDGVRDRRAFAVETAHDPRAGVPAGDRLAALRGKDVIVAVVESYGTTALPDPGVAAALADGERDLAAAGFGARTGELASPVAGGGSWLAHATLYSGLWIPGEQRYRDLTASSRLTLPRAFRDAGWDTCAVMPGTTRAWPEGEFYGIDRVWNDDRLGYSGPRFSWSPMPDQYALAAYQRLEHGRPDRPAQFCEVVLTSSHAPWTPLPRPVGWDVADDPEAYAPMAGPQASFDSVYGDDPARVRANYLAATRYSLATLVSWIRTYGDDRTVLVVLGDHQPMPTVTGADAPRTVPISVIARDPAVLDRVAPWGWASGLRPAPVGPVWPMSAFRDAFLDAFAAVPPAPAR